MKLRHFLFIFLLFTSVIFGQKFEYSILTIPDSLKQNANAVVRNSELNITIRSQKSMTLKSKVVTTVLNELGLKNLDLSEYYDKNRKILKIEAIAYDAFGKEIKSFKKKISEMLVLPMVFQFSMTIVLYILIIRL